MRIKFKNGSYIKSIDGPENIKGVEKELDMSDIDWFCDFFGLKLFAYQKVVMWLQCHNEIHKMRSTIERLTGIDGLICK